MKQLDLWEQEEKAGFVPGDTFEINLSWADGDTDPAELERLARVNLGNTGKERGTPWYRIVSTDVLPDRVVALCRVIPPPPGYAPLASVEDMEDEE